MVRRFVTCVAFACSLTLVESVGAQTARDAFLSDAVARVEATRPPAHASDAERPTLLVPLYASLVGLQASDTVSTLIAVRDHGAREMNPAMRPFADNWAGMLLVKGGSTAITIAVEKLWKKNRAAAVASMIGINVAYSLVVAHNLPATR